MVIDDYEEDEEVSPVVGSGGVGSINMEDKEEAAAIAEYMSRLQNVRQPL
jgi:hypothetical protein